MLARWPPPLRWLPYSRPLCAACRPSVLPVRLLPQLLALRPLLALLWARQWLRLRLSHLPVLPLPRLKSSLLPCKSHHRLHLLPP